MNPGLKFLFLFQGFIMSIDVSDETLQEAGVGLGSRTGWSRHIVRRQQIPWCFVTYLGHYLLGINAARPIDEYRLELCRASSASNLAT